MAANVVDQLFQNLVSGVVKKAGVTAAQSPEIQGAIGQLQDEYQKMQVALYVAGGLAGLTFIFFVMPRMENPIPRVLRKKR